MAQKCQTSGAGLPSCVKNTVKVSTGHRECSTMALELRNSARLAEVHTMAGGRAHARDPDEGSKKKLITLLRMAPISQGGRDVKHKARKRNSAELHGSLTGASHALTG